MSKDEKNFQVAKLKEIKNGRLAMLAFVGEQGGEGRACSSGKGVHNAALFMVLVTANSVIDPLNLEPCSASWAEEGLPTTVPPPPSPLPQASLRSTTPPTSRPSTTWWTM